MSKRFGRNQRRKLRTELKSTEIALRAEQHFRQDSEQRHSQKLQDAIEAARWAGDTIKIDIDALVDPMERNIRITARLDNMMKRTEPLYAAYQFKPDDILRRNELEREAFITVVGKQIAEHALHQIVRHWRSR